jgi:hypothetical protein
MGELSRASKYSTYLFALPGLAESLGRVLDLAGAMSELNLLGEPGVDDLLAIAADWAAIGGDLWAALGVEVDEEKLAVLALLAAVLEGVE